MKTCLAREDVSGIVELKLNRNEACVIFHGIREEVGQITIIGEQVLAVIC